MIWDNPIFGLSFERPYLMKGLNLMIAKFTKSTDFGTKTTDFADFKKTQILKTTDFVDFEKTADFMDFKKTCRFQKIVKSKLRISM